VELLTVDAGRVGGLIVDAGILLLDSASDAGNVVV